MICICFVYDIEKLFNDFEMFVFNDLSSCSKDFERDTYKGGGGTAFQNQNHKQNISKSFDNSSESLKTHFKIINKLFLLFSNQRIIRHWDRISMQNLFRP